MRNGIDTLYMESRRKQIHNNLENTLQICVIKKETKLILTIKRRFWGELEMERDILHMLIYMVIILKEIIYVQGLLDIYVKVLLIESLQKI